MSAEQATLPRVSIVTPSFNQGRFLSSAIDSVLSQDYPEIEYLVIDGGSTDESLDVLRGYGDRVAWISEPDDGQADAIDKGIRRTSGEVLAWLNADDRYLPGAVTAAVDAFVADPTLAVVYGDAETVDPDGHRIETYSHVEVFDLARLVNVLDYIVQPATFFTRTAYESAGGLDRSLHYCLDYDLWIRMGRLAPMRYVNRTLAQVRLHPDTKTASGGLPRLLEIEAMIRRHGRPLLPDSFQREMVITASRALATVIREGRWADAPPLTSQLMTYLPPIAARRVRRVGGSRT